MIWATLKIINFRISKWEFQTKLWVLQICKFITQAYKFLIEKFQRSLHCHISCSIQIQFNITFLNFNGWELNSQSDS
jgi:hypothetical protein